ncbi:tail fiber assembly protein [Morganella morganii]|uniref:tail fiber assembly protein n=1 Tax=Morganella morganii TaxID=582 RepID=UPI0032DA3DD7
MNIFFSGSNLSFYDGSMKQDYVTAGTWPDDAIEMTDKERGTYWMQRAPDGKVLGRKKGRPVWVDIPQPTHNELVQQARAKKEFLISEVESETSMLRTKLALGRIKEDEKALLNAWLDYLELLEAIDTSLAPDINWPLKPV